MRLWFHYSRNDLEEGNGIRFGRTSREFFCKHRCIMHTLLHMTHFWAARVSGNKRCSIRDQPCTCALFSQNFEKSFLSRLFPTWLCCSAFDPPLAGYRFCLLLFWRIKSQFVQNIGDCGFSTVKLLLWRSSRRKISVHKCSYLELFRSGSLASFLSACGLNC